jgi:hypothetical protein
MKKKNVRIYETLNSVSDLSSQKTSDGLLRLSGVFGVCGKRNQNNRVYEKRNYQAMVERLQGTIRQGAVLGELEHPKSMNINLKEVSHKIESITMNEDGTITGTIVLLNTPNGKQAQAIVEGGCPLYISSRGCGSIDNAGNVVLEDIKTYDLVGTPGFSEARMDLAPNQKFESLNESCCVIYEDDETEEEDDEPKAKKGKKSDDDTEEPATPSEEYNKLKSDFDALVKKFDELNSKYKDILDHVEDVKEDTLNVVGNTVQEWLEKEWQPEQNKKIGNGVEKWVTEEFAPIIQKWVVEEYSDQVQKWVTEEYSTGVEKWITEELAPVFEKWVVEEYSDQVQKWVSEEYSGTLQNWITEELAPTFEKWIVEEYSGKLSEWVKEEVCPEIYTNINDYITESKKTDLSNIDQLLDVLETSNSKEEVKKSLMTEGKIDKYANNPAVKAMPKKYKPLWESMTDAKKQQILQNARLYSFLNENMADKFWSKVNFTAQPIVESQVENVKTTPSFGNYKDAIRSGIRRLNNHF